MYKVLTIVFSIILCLISMTTAFAAAAEVVTSNDLIDKAKDYDGHEVSYTGEVIGDIMDRGEYSWINVSDGNNAIGIWVKTSDLQDINIAGRYNTHGDTVNITGVFHRACAEHGGDFDIHAGKIVVVQKGFATSHALSPIKAVLAFILFGAALGCVVFLILKTKR
jgi:hypothetical protein